MSLKNPVTPPEIDPGTVRLVAQRLNHYATPGPKHRAIQYIKCKGNDHPRTGHEGPEGGQMYSPSLPSTFGARWWWVVNAMPRQLYPPGKTRLELYRRLLNIILPFMYYMSRFSYILMEKFNYVFKCVTALHNVNRLEGITLTTVRAP
jgi:hypothetical protein